MIVAGRRPIVPSDVARKTRDWLTCERHLLGAALLRVGLALIVLYLLVGHWAQRDFLWGPRGVYPVWLFERDLPLARSPSFFATESEPLFQAMCVLTAIVSVLYLIGWQTRWLAIWFYLLTWSLITRNPMLRSGGESMLLALLPFAVLLDSSAYFSIDSDWRRPGSPAARPARPFLALLHNIGLIGIFTQLAIIYGFAGTYKLFGQAWPAGSAVYYTMRLPQVVLPGISELIYLNQPLVRILTYLTLAFELSFPFLIWSRRTRWLPVLGAVGFHAFIAIFLGFALFAAESVVFELVVLDDGVYRRAHAWWRRVTSRLPTRLLPIQG